MIPAEAVEAAAKALADELQSEYLPEAWMDIATAALEAAAPHMLATVSTVAELDALPRFTVIRSDEGAVFERQTMWHEAGSRDLMCSPDITLFSPDVIAGVSRIVGRYDIERIGEGEG